MNKGLRRLGYLMGCMTLWLFVFSELDLARAKDPDYPTRPINYIYPFSAGGSGEVAARALLGAASKHLGQPLVLICKPGAGGAIAATTIINSKPDGYTIGTGSGSSAFVVPFSDGAPYRDLTGFTFIMNFSDYINTVMVKADSPGRLGRNSLNGRERIQARAKLAPQPPKSSQPKAWF